MRTHGIFDHSAVGCWFCVHGARMFKPARLSREESIVMLLFSVLYTINIVCVLVL